MQYVTQHHSLFSKVVAHVAAKFMPYVQSNIICGEAWVHGDGELFQSELARQM